MPPLTIILVEKTGELKTLSIKDYKEDELFKKCGFKKADDFSKHIDWSAKIDGQKYIISLYGKSEGKANMENKYDFPPPVDNKLYFGCCALVAQISDDLNKKSLSNLSLDLWNKIYDKLFLSIVMSIYNLNIIFLTGFVILVTCHRMPLRKFTPRR